MSDKDKSDSDLIAEHIDVDRNYIVHLLLPDHTEVIGEVLIDEEKKDVNIDCITLLHPIKLQKITSINENVIEEDTVLVKWSEISKYPFTYINTKNVISMTYVDDNIVDMYLNAILQAYHDPSELWPKDNEEPIVEISDESNIIQFPTTFN